VASQSSLTDGPRDLMILLLQVILVICRLAIRVINYPHFQLIVVAIQDSALTQPNVL